MNTVELGSRHRPAQEFAADGREDRVGQNRVDHAPAALDLRAPAHDELHGVLVVAEWNLVMVAHAPLDPAELQADDIGEHHVAQWIIRNYDQPSEQRRRKFFQERFPQRGRDTLRTRHQLRVLAHAHDQLGTDVRRQQDDRVPEVDAAALAVLHRAFVEHLEEQLVDVRMRLLHFVEQHHAVRAPPDRLGENAPLAIAHVSGGRSFERGDGMGLLELAHVDRDHVLLAAVEGFGQRQRGFGLADA